MTNSSSQLTQHNLEQSSDNKSSPLVSVLLCTYNDKSWLLNAVQSILSQQSVNLELILVDDGSTDGGVDEIEGMNDPRIQIIKKKNTGLTDSLNHGLAFCEGDFIARQDADDRSLPMRLKKQVEYMLRHQDVGVLGCASQIIDEDGDELQSLSYPQNHAELLEKHITSNQFIHGSLMMRHELLNEISGYRNEFVYSQDYDLTLRAQEVCKVENLAEVLYQSRFGGQRISSEKVNEQKACANMARHFAKQRRNGKKDSIQNQRFSGNFLSYADDQNNSAANNDHVLLYLYLRAGLGEKTRQTIKKIAVAEECFSFKLTVKFLLTYLPKSILKSIYQLLDNLR